MPTRRRHASRRSRSGRERHGRNQAATGSGASERSRRLLERVPGALVTGRYQRVRESILLRTLGAIVLLGSIGAALLDYVFKVYAADEWGRDNDLLRFFAFFHTGVAVVSCVMGEKSLTGW